MKTQHYILGISLLALGLNLPTETAAQTATVDDSQQSLQNEINKSKSAKERIASNRVRRNHTFSDFGQAYTDFKNRLNKDYGFDYSVDISYMGQRAAPNGKKNSMQTYIYPSITWTTFNNEYGTGTLNAAYTIIRYGGKNGSWLGNHPHRRSDRHKRLHHRAKLFRRIILQLSAGRQMELADTRPRPISAL